MENVASKPHKKRLLSGTSKLRAQKIVLICTFLLIPLTLLFMFTYYPLGQMIYYSLFHWRTTSANPPILVAFGASEIFEDNYLNIFTHSEYWTIFKVSGVYLIGSFVQIALALFFATIFYYRPRGGKFFKAVLFLPSLLNGVAIGLMFLLFFKSSDENGIINTLAIKYLGIAKGDQIKWFGTFWLGNTILTSISVWRYMGNNMVMFAGTMESINHDEIEAAEIDGANKWQQFWYILLPGIKQIIVLNLILAVNGAVQVYEIPLIMQPSNPLTQTFITKTLNIAFSLQHDIGLGSALGIVLLFIVLFVAGLQKIVEKAGNND
jgi:ABC-type sugar transport system permease subunit